MAFDPAFALLKKFTVGIPPSLSGSDTINKADVAAVAKYLGIELQPTSLSENTRAIENELVAQNHFLTKNLTKIDVEQSTLYDRSKFVREVISNNRSKART